MRHRYILAYDIRTDQRLREVYDVARSFGSRMQYSVFVCDLDKRERITLELELRSVMNLKVDSVALVDLGPTDGSGRTCFTFIGSRPFSLPDGGPMIV